MKRIFISFVLLMLACASVYGEWNCYEDPFTFVDGTKVVTKDDWARRREEILEIFQHQMYGRRPADCPVYLEEIEHGRTSVNGIPAIREQVRMYFKADKSGPEVDWLIVRPGNAEGRVPAIITLNYTGNHTMLPDEQIVVPDCWLDNWADYYISDNRAQEAGRGCVLHGGKRYHYPIDFFLANGFAFVTACYGELSSDPEDKTLQSSIAYNHLFELWQPRDSAAKDNTMALMAWGWALSRGLDMLEQHNGDNIDVKRVLVTGCSRLGKAALLAGAYDERFAVVVPIQTGSGGMPLSKHVSEGKETVASETTTFTHWFCENYRQYAGNEENMPFDQHLLVSCIAPRPILSCGFDNKWFDTRGEFLNLQISTPVWEFFGKSGLPSVAWPETDRNEAIGENMGYYHRHGKHGIIMEDWTRIIAFAAKHLR